MKVVIIMQQNKIKLIQTVSKTNGGLIKTSELREIGISSRKIKELLELHIINRIKYGHYMLTEETAKVSDIELAAKLIPHGVICLFTAIEHHELSTVNPTAICIALPRDISIPLLPKTPNIKIYRMTSKHFELGITETDFNGTSVRIFDVEKTVCDCFKYDKDIEKAVALEALKNYITKGNCNVQKLLEYAKIMGKKKTIIPYVEALI